MSENWRPKLGPKTQALVDQWPEGKFDRELRKFTNHAADKGRTSKDWNAAFRTWLENADEWMKRDDRSQTNRRNSPGAQRTTGTTSPEPSTTLADFTTIDLTNLPKRLSDTQLAQVETVANLPLPKSSPSSDEQFAACMRSLDILPRRADDRTRAELRVKLYQRKLGVFPYHVLGQMVSKALDTCKFFPTISECLAMLPPTDSDCASIRARAKSVAEIEHQHRWTMRSP